MTTDKPITIQHSGVAVTYDERDNRWHFTLRGRDRSADSLTAAKESIDKPVPEKAKPFEKIPAWLFNFLSEVPVKVEVTGIAESRYSHETEVWIKNGKDRSKQRVSYCLFPANDKNDAIMAQVIERRATIEKLSKEIGKLRDTLAPLVIEKEPA